MKIPLPCKFGELSDCDGKLLPLCGVHWFDWMSGRQYTYFEYFLILTISDQIIRKGGAKKDLKFILSFKKIIKGARIYGNVQLYNL